MSLELVEYIELPKIEDDRGNLSYIESKKHIPFKIQRVYWIYDVPGGEIRGGHAFKEQHEFIIALSGSFSIVINDGRTEKRINLKRSYNGIYIPPLIWRHMDDFSTNSIACVMSSTFFHEDDYIRDFADFRNLI